MKLKINFTLKTGVQGKIPVIAVINFGFKEYDILKKKYDYKPLKYYTGISVERDEWDNEKKLPYARDKSSKITSLEKVIESVYDFLLLKGDVTPALLKAELDERIKGKTDTKRAQKIRIHDFIDSETLQSSSISEGTKKAYRGLANKLLEFETKIGKQVYTNDFNESLYKEFIDDVRLRLNRNNAVWSVQKVLISTLHEIARKYKIQVFDPTAELANKDRITLENVNSIYLNMDQINQVIAFSPVSVKLQNTKLILLTLLFTGCRISDVHKIKPEFTYSDKGETFQYARYISEKTDTEIIVPILKPLADAFEQNNGQPAYKIAQQKFNDYVKELILACEMDEEITISYTDSFGKKKFESKPLYQFVSSHIGRRSFITNLINHIPITILTKITGHTLQDKNIIFGYNKISLIENTILFRKQLKRAVEENPEYFPFELV